MAAKRVAVVGFGFLMLAVFAAAAVDSRLSSVQAQEGDGDWIDAARRPSQAARSAPAIPLPQRKPPKPRRTATEEGEGAPEQADASTEPPSSLPAPPPPPAQAKAQEDDPPKAPEMKVGQEAEPAADEPELDVADDANEELLPQSARASERTGEAEVADESERKAESTASEPSGVPLPDRASADVKPDTKPAEADESAGGDAVAAKMPDRLPVADETSDRPVATPEPEPQSSPQSDAPAVADAPVEPETPEPVLSGSWPHEARIAGLALPAPAEKKTTAPPTRLSVPLPVKKPAKPVRRAERREEPRQDRRPERSTRTPRPETAPPSGSQAAKCEALGKCRAAFAKCKAAFIKKHGEWDLEKEPCGAVYQACIRKSFQPGEMFFTRWFWPYDNCP